MNEINFVISCVIFPLNIAFIETGYLTQCVLTECHYIDGNGYFNAIPCTLTTLTINGASFLFFNDLEPYLL